MGVFDRFTKLVQTSVTELLAGADDPERLLEAAIVEMEKELSHARIRLTDAEHLARSRREMVDARKAEATRFETQAKELEAEGRRDAAKDMRAFHQKALSSAQSLETEAAQSEREAAELKDAVDGLQKTIDDATAKKEEVGARLKEVRSRAGPRIHAGSTDPFTRAEARTAEREASSSSNSTGGERTRTQVEWELENLQRRAAVDEQLEAIKRRMREQK